MRKFLISIVCILSVMAINAQKLSLRCNFNALQVQSWQINSRINVDTQLHDGQRFYIDSFMTRSRVVSEIPGLSVEFRFPSNWFIESGLNYSMFNYRDSYFTGDSLKSAVDFRMHRATATWEGGYYFRRAKIFKPYFATGLSLSKMYAAILSVNDKERFGAYKDYFKNSPFFLSMNFRAGLKFGMVSVGFAFSSSLTKTSVDGKMGKYNTFTLFSISSDIIRTSSLKKSQYKSPFESDDFTIKKSQSLKQTENSWIFGMTYYRFYNLPFIIAYSQGATDHRIEPTSPPRVAFIPTVGGKTLNAKNAKRTFYAQSNFTMAIIAMNYEDVYTTTYNAQQFTTPQNNPISVNTYDVKMSYLDLIFGGGHGYKIKTTPRTFIFAEYDAKLHTIMYVDKQEVEKIPPLKRFFLTFGIEAGFRFRHSGFSLNFARSLGHLDKFSFYDKMFSLSLKFTYDISTK